MKRKLFAGLALIALLAALPLSQAGAAPQASRTTSPVTLTSDPSVVVGSSTLTRTASGISFTLEASGLQPGHAVTIWWMVTNPDGGTAVLYAAGHVVGGDGTTTFAGYLAVGDSTGSVMGDDTTLEDALAATVTLVVRDHGPGRADILTDQIHTFEACNPTCTDLQTSVHAPNWLEGTTVEPSHMIRVTAGSGSIEVVATAATPDEVDVITREVIKMTLEDAVERIRSALLRAPNG